MSKFKSGDKVKITSCSGSHYWYADKIGEVFTILGPSEFGYYVTKKMVPYTMFSVKECDIELASEEWVDGVPQAGAIREAYHEVLGEWCSVEILAQHPANKEAYVCINLSNNTLFWSRTFRPLKTQEEIEREEAVKEMDRDISDSYDHAELLAEYLISKGWRKK